MGVWNPWSWSSGGWGDRTTLRGGSELAQNKVGPSGVLVVVTISAVSHQEAAEPLAVRVVRPGSAA